MKFSIILLLAFCLHASAGGYAQNISLSVRNASLPAVLKEIKKQAGVSFVYGKELMDKSEKVTIQVVNQPLEKVLAVLFADQPLDYQVSGNFIVLSPKASASPPAPDKDQATPPPPIDIRGRILDTDGNPVIATITEKGTRNATTSDGEGYYTLTGVNENATLVISAVNIETLEVRVNNRATINATATIKIPELDAPVMVAYNTTTQRKNTAAVTLVKGEQIQNLPNRSLDKSLQGLVPGLLVTSGTGQPGGGISNFVLRGISTGSDGTSGSTVRNPLIVIDGVPVSQDHVQWNQAYYEPPVMNPMAQLNPSDIESITVLKDAAAIALYGSKASNGVILITTKKGKTGKTQFSFRHQTDIASRLKGKIDLMNQDEYLALLIESYRNYAPSLYPDDASVISELKTLFPVRSDGSFYPATNWESWLYNDHAATFSNELSMSGGNERSNFYLNMEYTTQNGVVKKTGYDRKSLRFNFENRPVDWFRLGLNSALSYNVQDYASIQGNTYISYAAWNSPLNPVRLEDGTYFLNFDYPTRAANPVAAAEYNTKKNTGYRGLAKLYGEAGFLKNFKFTAALGIDFMLMEAKERIDPRLFDEYTYSTGSGRVQERETRNANLITTNTLRFDRLISSKHAVNILLGQEAQILTNKYVEGTATNLRLPGDDQVNDGRTRDGRGVSAKETLVSYFGQANYGYMNKYFFSGSIRQDGSSRFGDRNRLGAYWSVGAGWLISSEKFMSKTSSWLDYLKIRGSLGAAGNSFAIGRTTRYDILTIWSYANNVAAVPYYPGNPDIKWEQTFSWDAGLEARFLKERIAVTADIYNKKTTDVVYPISLPGVSGYAQVPANIGDMKNSGIELSLSADIIRKRNFTWNLDANWSTNKNVLTKADVTLRSDNSPIANEVGRNFNSFYMIRWAGVSSADGSPQWLDSTGAPNSNAGAAKKEFVGKPQPDGFGAVTNTFKYKNFTLSALLYYQYGFQVYQSDNLITDGSNPYFLQDKRALDRWQKSGDIARNPKPSLYNASVYTVSTRNLFDGSFIRLQNISVAYDFPGNIVSRLGLNKLRVYVQAHNLALWNKFPGADPATTTAAGSAVYTYPDQRSYSFGININF